MLNINPYDCLKSSQEIRQWYDQNYHLLSLSGLWLKGGEPNTMDPALFSQAELRFLICRLSTYRDVSTSISHSLIAQIAGEVEGVFTDFAFLPPPRDIDLMAVSRVPPWVGTTTKEPPTAFHVLGISNSFVLELLNLPKLLHLSGIPLFKTERMLRDDVPFVILGGASSGVTSVLHGPPEEQGVDGHYGLVDAVFIGEGEYSIKQFLEMVKRGRSRGWSKKEILKACHGKVDGFYEPDKYEHRYEVSAPTGTPLPIAAEGLPLAESEGTVGVALNGKSELREITPKEAYVSFPVKSAVVHELDKVRAMESCPVWYDTESLGLGSVQISTGCPCFCAFCAESWERKPYRERSLSRISESLKTAKARQGLDTVNLLSFNFNTHAELYPMILSLYREMDNVSLKSQRFDLLAGDRFLAEVQQTIGKTTVSCGMEGISERLRRRLHKNLTEAQIYKACESLFKRGIRELKIFLIATGLEQGEDFVEFERFVKSLESLKSMSDSHVRIIFSLTPLYYPPHTPLQFHACLTSLGDIKNVKKAIERACKSGGMEFRESASFEEMWLTQLLAKGDRRLTPALIRSSIEDGMLYYNVIPKQALRNWRGYLADLALTEEDYFSEKGEQCAFPWDDIDTGVPKRYLWEEYQRSLDFAEREYCLGRPHVDVKCLGCGACPTADHRKNLTQHTMQPPFFMEELHKIARNKQSTITLSAVVEIDASLRLVPKRFVGVALARAIMMAMPEIVPYYKNVSGYLSEFNGEKTPADFIYGVNVYKLTFFSKDRSLELLSSVSLSQKQSAIQALCRGFKVKECILNPVDEQEVKYVLYRFQFGKEFTRPLVEQKLEEYLRGSYVKYTLLKRNDQTIFKVDTKSKKNAVAVYAKIGKTGTSQAPEAGFSVVMAVTTRFDLQVFLETCYGVGRRREIVCTHIEALGYYGRYPTLQKQAKCVCCGDNVNETFLFGQPLEDRQCLVCSVERLAP